MLLRYSLKARTLVRKSLFFRKEMKVADNYTNKVTREYQSLMKLTPTDGTLESLRNKNFSLTQEEGKRVKMEIMNYYLTMGINIQELNFSTLIIKTLNGFVQNIILGF